MSRVVQCMALLAGAGADESVYDRLARVSQALEVLQRSREDQPDLSIMLAPEGFLNVDDQPLDVGEFRHIYAHAMEMFADVVFARFLILPGTLVYRDGDSLFHAQPCFLGGSRIACQVLQQTFDPRSGLPQSRNATFRHPFDARVLGGAPAERIDHFRPETGLRVGIEIGEDHFDGHLWSAFANDPDFLPDLQLVPTAGRSLTDQENRIPGNTTAVRSGGLLFGCCGPCDQNSGSAQLFRSLGDGLFQPIKPTSVLTGAGLVYRYSNTVL